MILTQAQQWPHRVASRRTGDTHVSEFMMWCVQNHRPLDSQSLGKYVQANDLTAQDYRDLSAFLAGMGYQD
jgi:hypothetical protein